jgi:lycopene beta-cyclase
MSEKFQFLAMLGICLLVVLPLEFVGGARILRRPKALLSAWIGPFVVLSVLNEVAVNRELWRYSPRFTSGIELPRHYLVEEVAFFVVVPMCALLVFEATNNRLAEAATSPHSRPGSGPPVARFVSGVLLCLCAVLLLIELWVERARLSAVTGAADRLLKRIDWDVPEYPVLTVGLIAGVLFVESTIWRTGIFRMRAYWLSLCALLVMVVAVNVWLSKTSMPIVVYSRDELTGLRPIGNMPVEDIGFDLAAITLVLMSWIRVTRQHFVPET